jgi:hypothetical protein
MRSFLRRLFPNAARGRSLRIRKFSRLLFERLDARKLLAADAVEPVEETVATLAPPAAEALPLELAAAVPDAGVESPLWGAIAPGGIGKQEMMSSDGGYGGYGGYGFIPPEIENFQGTESTPGMWTFSGNVVDDTGVYGLIVEFGGLLEGQSTMVRENGTFEFTIQLDPNDIGFATATVTDWHQITSQEVEWFVS